MAQKKKKSEKVDKRYKAKVRVGIARMFDISSLYCFCCSPAAVVFFTGS